MEQLEAAGVQAVEIQTTVENELDAKQALAELKENQCNALMMYLGNFGPEGPETIVAQPCDVCSGGGRGHCGAGQQARRRLLRASQRQL